MLIDFYVMYLLTNWLVLITVLMYFILLLWYMHVSNVFVVMAIMEMLTIYLNRLRLNKIEL